MIGLWLHVVMKAMLLLITIAIVVRSIVLSFLFLLLNIFLIIIWWKLNLMQYLFIRLLPYWVWFPNWNNFINVISILLIFLFLALGCQLLIINRSISIFNLGSWLICNCLRISSTIVLSFSLLFLFTFHLFLEQVFH